jgi:GNAT superfamily N-acetyltransferase
MSELHYRRGTIEDLDFLTGAILDAERSGAAHTVYERLFDLSPADVAATIKSMLAEEIPGSELCCESFLLAVEAEGGAPVGCIATWIEGEEGPPSNLVRANLLLHTLGEGPWSAARPRIELLRTIDVEREPGALQIEAVHVAEARRGKGLTRELIERALASTRAEKASVHKAQILSIAGNESGSRAFTRAGFTITRQTHSDSPAVRALFPGAGRLLWERALH